MDKHLCAFLHTIFCKKWSGTVYAQWDKIGESDESQRKICFVTGKTEKLCQRIAEISSAFYWNWIENGTCGVDTLAHLSVY